MHNYYITESGHVSEIEEYQDNCWLMLTNPTDKECRDTSQHFGIELDDVRAALDQDESSRVDIEDNYTLILIDIPTREAVNVAISYTTIPLGIILTKSCIITVCSKETIILKDMIFRKMRGLSIRKMKRFCCQILYHNCMVYQNLLKSIDRSRGDIEKKINDDMEDTDLINLHYLESNLVYFATSLRANASVLDKIKRYGILKEHAEDEELLDDTIIENMQAIETTKIYQDIIKNELNVKKVNFTDDVREFTSYTFKPQLRTVGPKYGKQLGGIRKYLAELDGNAAMDTLKADGALRFDVNGVTVELTEEDLLIDTARKEGYVSQEDGTFTVVLDTNLTPALVEEGYVYELISKIQTMRKESGFEVMDRIRVSLSGNEKLSKVAASNEAAIAGKVLAEKIEKDTALANEKKWDINGEKVTIGVQKM